jgi:hypothetical protein
MLPPKLPPKLPLLPLTLAPAVGDLATHAARGADHAQSHRLVVAKDLLLGLAELEAVLHLAQLGLRHLVLELARSGRQRKAL